MDAFEILQAIVEHCDSTAYDGALNRSSPLIGLAREALEEVSGVRIPRKLGMSDEDKARRRATLGSSEVAAVLGLNRWASAHDVWMSKCLGVDFDGNERTELGQLLEPTIMGIYCQRYDVQIVKGKYTLGPEPWMSCTPDGLVETKGDTEFEHGAEPLCEAKLVGLRSLWLWGPGNTDEQESDDIPDHYLVQALWQLACKTGAPYVDVSALLGTEFRSYRIRRDERTIGHMINRCREWWHSYVVPKIPPPVDGSDGATAMIRALYPNSSGERIKANKDLESIARRLHEARLSAERAESEKKLAENQMREALRDAGGAYGDGWTVRYRKQKDGKRPLVFAMNKEAAA